MDNDNGVYTSLDEFLEWQPTNISNIDMVVVCPFGRCDASYTPPTQEYIKSTVVDGVPMMIIVVDNGGNYEKSPPRGRLILV